MIVKKEESQNTLWIPSITDHLQTVTPGINEGPLRSVIFSPSLDATHSKTFTRVQLEKYQEHTI